MPIYKPTDQVGQPLNVIYAEDIWQLADLFSGNRDGGPMSLLQPLATPPAPTSVTLSSGGITGTGYQWGIYWITGFMDGTGAAHITGRTPYGTLTGAQALTAQKATVSISAVTVPTGAIGWGVARNKSPGGTSSGFYTVPLSEQFLSVAGTMPNSFIDNVTDASLVTPAPLANTTGTTLKGAGQTLLYDSGPIGAATATLTAASLPVTYNHLIAVIYGRSNAAVTSTAATLQLNGDSTSGHYGYGYNVIGASSDGGSSTSQTAMQIGSGAGLIPGTSDAAAGDVGIATISLPFYASTSWNKNATWQAANGRAVGTAEVGYGWWTSTAAVTQLAFSLASGSWVANSRLLVYGIV